MRSKRSKNPNKANNTDPIYRFSQSPLTKRKILGRNHLLQQPSRRRTGTTTQYPPNSNSVQTDPNSLNSSQQPCTPDCAPARGSSTPTQRQCSSSQESR